MASDAPAVEFAGDRMSVRFDRFGPAAYARFLQVKRLPESSIEFDPADESYTVTAPARFAALLGAVRPAAARPVRIASHLFPDQRQLTRQALDAKRFALWCACGFGKTPMGPSPLHDTIHALHPWVAFIVLPVFAFANAGVPLDGVTLASLVAPVPLGIALGLILGKPIGILAASALAVRIGAARLPSDLNWRLLTGAALLCGIGFTMSLFIGSLAFSEPARIADVKLGVLLGSVVSGLLGYSLLRFATAGATQTSPTARLTNS